METQSFDIALVGGGMVGLSLAVSLADVGARVAVIERASIQDMEIARPVKAVLLQIELNFTPSTSCFLMLWRYVIPKS